MNTDARSTAWTADRLNALPREELVEIFLGLPSPTSDEFDGELHGYPAAYLAEDLVAHLREAGLGNKWLGKGFVSEPHDHWTGHGYNIWETDDGPSRRTRFGWELGTSVLDRRPCLLIHYRAFANIHADLDLVDEVRKVDDGLFLGVAFTKDPSPICPLPGGPDGRTLPSTFLLTGPATPWVGPDDPAAELRVNRKTSSAVE